MISEALFDHTYDDGYSYDIMKGIVGHRKNSDAININDGYIEINVSKKKIITYKGWYLNIEWEYGSSSWLPLRIMKKLEPGQSC